MAGATITIVLAAETERANSAIRSFFSGLNDRINQVKSLNKELQNGSAALNQFAAAFGTVLGIGAIRGFIREAVTAGRATAQLDAALKATGQSTKEYSKELENQRKAISDKIGADDDQLVAVQRLLVQFGVQRDMILEMTQLTMDYAAAMNMDAASAAIQLGRALQGQDIQLRGMQIQLDKTLPKMDQLRMLMAILQKQVGGQAEALSDPIARFNVQLGDTEKAFGRLFLDDIATPFLKSLGKGLGDLEEKLKQFNQEFPTLSGWLKTISAETGEWLGKLGPLLVGLGAVALAFKALQFALSPLAALLRLTRLGLVAIAGADVIGLLSQVRNYRDLAAALDLIVKNTALARVGLIGLSAAGGYGIGRLLGSQVSVGGKTIDEYTQNAFGKFLFGKGTTASDAQLAASNEAFEATIIRVIGSLAEAGTISRQAESGFEAQANALRDAKLSAVEYHEALMKLAAAIRAAIGEQEKQRSADFLFDQFLKRSGKQSAGHAAASSAAVAPALLAAIQLEEAQNEAAYKFGEIGLRKYLDIRRRLVNQAASVEMKPLQQQVKILTNEIVEQTDIINRLMAEADAKRENGQPVDYAELEQLRAQIDQLIEEKQKLESQLNAIESKRQGSQLEINSQARENTFAGAFGSTIQELGDQWGSWAKQMATSFKEVFNGAIDSISNGITGLIMGTMTWGQALRQIGTTILSTIINAIISMGIRWIATRIMMAVAGKSIEAASIAATVPIAAAHTAIWAVPATLATIATYGSAAAAAPGFVALAEGVTMAESLAGFLKGGYTGDGDPNQPAGIVHRGEIVIPADKVKRYGRRFFEGILSGADAVGDFASARSAGSSSRFADPIVIAGAPAATPELNHTTELKIASFGGEADAQRWANSEGGEIWFHDMMRRNAWRYQR